MLIFSSCPKGITRLFLGRRTSNTRASSVFRSDWRPPRDHPFTRPLGPGDIARGSPEPGEAGRPAATVDPGSSFPWSAPARGRREGGGGVDPSCGARTRSARSPRASTRRMSPPRRGKGGRWSADRALFRRNSCRGRAWRGCSAFSGPPPCTATPLKTWPPRGEATRAALSGPLRERTDDHRTD